MDYCIACRRYLNGALACAGCGTPVEHLISAAPAAPAPGPAAGFGSDPAALADVYADSLVVLSGEGGQGRGQRRAAGRRAGHRRRRRTALTVGLGLMLAAGGTLGLARLTADGERTDRAATVVLTDDAGPAEPAPLPGLTQDPAVPSGTASAKGPAAGSAKAGGAKTGGTGRSAGASSAGASGSSSGAGPSRSASRTPVSAAPATSGSSGSASPGQSSKGPKGKPPGKSSSPSPSPSPTPTRDCWWFFC